eukprot:scaffold18009_cov61-Phaeocystis_antarctica.AAC.7
MPLLVRGATRTTCLDDAARPRRRPAAPLPQLPRRPRPEPLRRRLDQDPAAILHGRAVAAAPAAASGQRWHRAAARRGPGRARCGGRGGRSSGAGAGAGAGPARLCRREPALSRSAAHRLRRGAPRAREGAVQQGALPRAAAPQRHPPRRPEPERAAGRSGGAAAVAGGGARLAYP